MGENWISERMAKERTRVLQETAHAQAQANARAQFPMMLRNLIDQLQADAARYRREGGAVGVNAQSHGTGIHIDGLREATVGAPEGGTSIVWKIRGGSADELPIDEAVEVAADKNGNIRYRDQAGKFLDVSEVSERILGSVLFRP